MSFDRSDIVEAHYAFCCDYHSGQGSDLYRRLSGITEYFTPGVFFKGFDSLTENGQDIYGNLQERYRVLA